MTPDRSALPWRNLSLLAARAVWRASDKTLFVADLHLGKTASFRAAGSAAPSGVSAETLDRLGALVDSCGASRLVALGDFLHARGSMTKRLSATLRDWRAARPCLTCVLVRGNHDRHAGDPDAGSGFACVDAPHEFEDLEGRHHPLDDIAAHRDGPIVLAGHIHPVATMHGPGRDRLTLPCFVVSGRQVVLPAFGEFTGGARISAAPGRWLGVTTGSDLFVIR